MKIQDINSQTIETEIEKFESKVDFEFIPVISPQSSYVEHVPWMLSLVLILLSFILMEIISSLFLYDSWYDKSMVMTAGVILSIIASSILSRFNFTKRLFISKIEKARQVQEQAEKIFFLQRLAEIKSQNALLVYISVMEKRIVILPDPKIKMHDIGQLTKESIEILQKAFKEKEFEEGLINVIRHLQNRLEKQFPRGKNAENIVSNKLIWWKD